MRANFFLSALEVLIDRKHTPTHPSCQAYLLTPPYGRTSLHVLHEYYDVATRKLRLQPVEIRLSVRRLFAWNPVVPDLELFQRAWLLQDRYGLSFWDTLVVAAAQAADCTHLLTEDMQDGQDLDGLLVMDPFSREAADLP